MSVIFTSTIKMADDQTWYIELKDMVDQRIEICKDMDEYSQKVEDLGSDYGGNIDSVNWYKDDNVPEHVMDTIRMEMAKHQAEIEEKLGEPLIKQSISVWFLLESYMQACQRYQRMNLVRHDTGNLYWLIFNHIVG